MKIWHNIKRWFKYRAGRMKIKMSDYSSDRHPLSKIQEKTLRIAYILMSDSDAEMMLNPIDNKCYITRHDENGVLLIFVTIQTSQSGCIINIIGRDITGVSTSRYHYDIWYNSYWSGRIVKKFYKTLSRKRNKMEDEIRKGDEENLETIYKHIQKLNKEYEHNN